jgi:peptidyl-prolyl cis-trans isomerase A (cyclophilin A)
MVRILQPYSRRSSSRSSLSGLTRLQQWIYGIVTCLATVWCLGALWRTFPQQAAVIEQRVEQDLQSLEQRAQNDLAAWETSSERKVGGVAITVPNGNKKLRSSSSSSSSSGDKGSGDDEANPQKAHCPYMKLSDLTSAERFPVASKERHMVTPPKDNEKGVALVCCDTTAGPWNILVHYSWAPLGAQRFVEMVQAQYFDTSVPLMRCLPGFLCQFGLNGHPEIMKPFRHSIPDDPNWLPMGPDHRQNAIGVKRFQRGYLAYAGAGVASRDTQFIVALADNGPLAGGSPWEVPWGELVGAHSYETLQRIYTGYGEKGPSQALLSKADALSYVKEHYPDIDYVNSCRIVDRQAGQA